MPHPLIDQLRFTRSEFQRALVGVTDEEARRRFLPMNCISWIIAHLAAQEQRYWLTFAQGQTPIPELLAYGFGKPASTPRSTRRGRCGRRRSTPSIPTSTA